MAELLQSPWAEKFDALVKEASSSLVLCSPFIGQNPCSKVADKLRKAPKDFSLFILTDLSRDNMLSGITDVSALLSLANMAPQFSIRFLPSLHAKVYVFDSQTAVVTSANLTVNGLSRNFEYGVLFSDLQSVTKIKNDILDYGNLGSPVSIAQLKLFAEITTDLREIRSKAEKTLKHKLKKEFESRCQAAEIEILKVRAAGRTPHAIFTQAILHILKSGPKTTDEIHRFIQGIHPDLCDDSVNTIIDGKAFGKKWKHWVRTAQQDLRRAYQIKLVGEKWMLL